MNQHNDRGREYSPGDASDDNPSSRDAPGNTPSDNAQSDSTPLEGEFDQLLRTAMLSRPEPAAPHNLVHRAMTIAKAQSAAIAQKRTLRLARQRRWMQISGMAATLLITAMLAGAAHRLWTRGDIAAIREAAASDSSSTTTDTDSGTTTSSTSSTGNTIAIVVVAELLVMGVVLMSSSRSGANGAWGPEAAGGLW